MKELFSLGAIHPSDWLKEGQEPAPKTDITLVLDSYGAARLKETTPVEKMFGEHYFYRSGLNESMREELKSIVDSITNVFKLKDRDLWIDLACNDTFMLGCVSKNLIRVGIDPVLKNESYCQDVAKNTDLVIPDFFSAKEFKKSKFGKQKAKVITMIAAFYDIQETKPFLEDIYECLDDQGLFVLQLSYTPLMIQQLAYDNLMNEHTYYYSLFNLKNLFEDNGFKILDCQLNPTNGGSFRVFFGKKNTFNEKLFGTQPYRDVCNFRVNSILEYEKTLKLDAIETWQKFYEDIMVLKEQVISFLKQEKAKGKVIYGWGASTKTNTLLQTMGIDNSLLDGIADRSPYKWGLRTAGTNIPVVSEQEMRDKKPHYIFVNIWHFLSTCLERERDLMEQGTKLIVPCPKFEIIGL